MDGVTNSELGNNQASRKKRGAPFKGVVLDNHEEKHKVQRQAVARHFKSFYEKRIYSRVHKQASTDIGKQSAHKKKKKSFKSYIELETALRKDSD